MRRITRKLESVTARDNKGNMKLVYDSSLEELPYDEFIDDLESIYPSKSAVVLKLAEEAEPEEGESDKVIARGGRAMDMFYDSCQDMWDETEDGIVAIVMPKYHEVTNFVYRLCDSKF